MLAWVILYIGNTAFFELPTKFAEEAACVSTLQVLVKQNHPVVRGAKNVSCVQVVVPPVPRPAPPAATK